MVSAASIFLTLALAARPVLGGLFGGGDVQVLSSAGLDRHLRSTEKGSLVAFVAPWCGYCKQLQPHFEKAATNLKNLVHLVAVDCDDDANKAACSQQYGVKGFPTLKYFAGVPHPRDYQGERSAKAMVDFSLEWMPTFARKARTKAELDQIIAKSTPASGLPSQSSIRSDPFEKERPLVVLFSKSKLTTPLYKALSSDFRKHADLYTAHETGVGAEAAPGYGVTSVPGLVVFTGSNSTGSVYSGPLRYDAISSFLSGFKPSTRKATGEL